MKKIFLLILTIGGLSIFGQIDYTRQTTGLSTTFIITQQGQFYESVKWDFGDGNFFQGTNEMLDTITHVYASTGNYEVCLVGYPMPASIIDSACKLVDLHSTGISPIKEGFNCTVYPNPVDNIAIIKINNNYVGSSYSIIDLTGKIVGIGMLTNEINPVEMSTLPRGIYIVKVGNLYSFKLIKK